MAETISERQRSSNYKSSEMHIFRRIVYIFFSIFLSMSAVSSINLGPIVIFASCVIHWPLICPTNVVFHLYTGCSS